MGDATAQSARIETATAIATATTATLVHQILIVILIVSLALSGVGSICQNGRTDPVEFSLVLCKQRVYPAPGNSILDVSGDM
jgi:hypothetical protein